MEDVGLGYPGRGGTYRGDAAWRACDCGDELSGWSGGRAATGGGRYRWLGDVPGETPLFVGNMAGERPSPPIRAERLSASLRSRAMRSLVEMRASCCESVDPESEHESDE